MINKNIMTVLIPLVNKQYFGEDLDLDEYDNYIYEPYYDEYMYVV